MSSESMTPMEAWAIISRRLTEWLIQKTISDELSTRAYKEQTAAEVICYQALKEMEERSKGEPR